VNTVNTIENPESPAEEPREQRAGETPASPSHEELGTAAQGPAADAVEEPVAAEAAEAGSAAGGPAAAEDAETGGAAAEDDGRTTIYVRRKRTPALGFWVVLAFVVPAVLALLSVPLFAFGDLRGIVNFVLLAMVVVGLPLAALASFIDARRHRGEGRGRR
jgi:hypothetical protein